MLEMFQYAFMVRAMIAGLAVAVVAPTVGIFLVTRRYSFMADTLSHVSLATTMTMLEMFQYAFMVRAMIAGGVGRKVSAYSVH
jgi:ABC-type Mn2+/Zn2+ transport system permease subunit